MAGILKTIGLICLNHRIEDTVVIVVLQGKNAATTIYINHKLSGGISNILFFFAHPAPSAQIEIRVSHYPGRP
jgi:hypothetical protein